MSLSVRNTGGALHCVGMVGRPQGEAKADIEIHGYNLTILALGR